MTPIQRADIEAIINAIGDISKTEALNAIDKVIGCVGGVNERSESSGITPERSEKITPSNSVSSPDQAIQQAREKIVDWLGPLLAYANDPIGDRIKLDRKIDALLAASRASQDWQPAVLHILNTLDAPAGEHHERFRAGWASAIGQMSARIQALPSIKEIARTNLN